MFDIYMCFVEGADLVTVLRRDVRLAPARAVRLLAGIADALDAAGERGLIHRDVKPANILVSGGAGGTEHAYLTDFGLAKRPGLGESLTATGQVVGTVDYLAPEQIEGRSIDRRVDVYALAGVL